jgi:hypothetical protein
MERTIGRASNNKAQTPEAEREEGSSELLEAFLKLRPEHQSNADALRAVSRELELLASSHGISVDDLLRDAHMTKDSKSYHHQVLQLERQLAFLRPISR